MTQSDLTSATSPAAAECSPSTRRRWDTYASFPERVYEHARLRPDARALTFLTGSSEESVSVTYAQLMNEVATVAAAIEAGTRRGDRVLLLYPPGIHFIYAFVACLASGRVAVPAYVPKPNPNNWRRLADVVSDSHCRLLMSDADSFSKMDQWLAQQAVLAPLPRVSSDRLPAQQTSLDQLLQELSGADTAFLQYTSGSTGSAKGVMVSHENLLHNSHLIATAFRHDVDSTLVTWLPLFHDLGLIANLLQGLYVGGHVVLLSPMHFVHKPIDWLRAIQKYDAQTSMAPNFAYQHCVDRISGAQFEGLDLQCWKVALNGAEHIRPQTLRQFVERFAPVGFSPRAFAPGYGLAEATVVVTASPRGELPEVVNVSVSALEQGRFELSDAAEGTRAMAASGRVGDGLRVVITDPETLLPCAEGGVGELWVQGPSVAQGYWNQPESSEATFRAHHADVDTGPFLRTGDLGVLHQGHLFVTGRIKEVLIVRGRNHYPQDLEATVYGISEQLRTDYGAAFTVEVDEVEELVLVQEVERRFSRSFEEQALQRKIRDAIWAEHSLSVHDVVLIKTGTLPKTSSGKIQRGLTKQLYVEGGLTRAVARNASQTPKQPAQPRETSASNVDELLAWIRTYYSRRVNSRLIDERRSVPPHIVLDFGNRGLLGLETAPELGGLGLSTVDAMRVIQQLGAMDQTLALFVLLHNTIGTRPIHHLRDAAQRESLLRDLASGRRLAAFALTEPSAGSHPRAIRSSARPSGDHWVLEGEKSWSGNAAWASVLNVFVQEYDEHGQPLGISGFLVPEDAPQLRQGEEALTMGMRGMVQNTVYLGGVPALGTHRLGAPGAGMAVAQDAMMHGRLAIGAASLGCIQRCAQLMLRYASRRHISTGQLLNHPLTQERLAFVCCAEAAVKALVNACAAALDAKATVPPGVYAAVKVLGSELLWESVDHLTQLLGGRGYIESNEAPQLLRDARILRIFEGPTETLSQYVGEAVIHDPAAFGAIFSQPDELKATLLSLSERCSAAWEKNPSQQAAVHADLGLATCYALARHALSGGGPDPVLRAWFEGQIDANLRRAEERSCRPPCRAEWCKKRVQEFLPEFQFSEPPRAGEQIRRDALLLADDEPIHASHAAPLPKAAAGTSTPAVPSNADVARRWSAFIEEWVRDNVLKTESAIDWRTPFADLGLNSLFATELTAELSAKAGCEVDSTAPWNHPTIEALAQKVATMVSEEHQATALAPSRARELERELLRELDE